MPTSSPTEELLQDQRWIVVADCPFLPARGGGEMEHLGFVRAVADRGMLAALVVPADADPHSQGREDDHDAIRRLAAPAPVLFPERSRSILAAFHPTRPYVVNSRPPTRGIELDLRAMAPDATGVVVFHYKSHRVGLSLARGLGLPAVIRAHNDEGRYHRDMARAGSGPRAWATGVEALRITLDERRLLRSFLVRGIADISKSDAARRAVHSRVAVEYVPPFALAGKTTSEAGEYSPSQVPTVVFVGALDISTNQEAVTWFAERVWNRIRVSVPNARWWIVGRRPPEWLITRAGRWAGAELYPDVPDVDSYLRTATVAVNPAVAGSGVNIKLAEYLAAGVPVVSTTLGAQGLSLTPGSDLEVADAADHFAAQVTKLLEDPTRARTLGAAGKEAAAELLDTDRSLALMAGLMTQPTALRN